jgi:uncharacterized protein
VIVVDTTVLVYAVGVEHALKAPSMRLFEVAATGGVKVTTTVEVIQEFAHIRARRFPRREAAATARNFARVLSPLLAVDGTVLERGLTLFERHPLGAFDAVLAAAALGHHADVLVSADAAFASVPRLRHVVPGTPEFERLIAA